MKNDTASHLGEAHILLSLVDVEDLPAAARAHLAACPHCQAARRRHADRLQRLAELAREAAPVPSRRVTLPAEMKITTGDKSYPSWSRPWKPALALAAMALVVIMLGTLWWTPRQERRLTGLNREMQEDQVLITEVQRLETDGLPLLYAAIAGDDDLDSDEDLWDLMVPGAQDDTLSGQRSFESGGNPFETATRLSLSDRLLEIWLSTV